MNKFQFPPMQYENSKWKFLILLRLPEICSCLSEDCNFLPSPFFKIHQLTKVHVEINTSVLLLFDTSDGF